MDALGQLLPNMANSSSLAGGIANKETMSNTHAAAAVMGQTKLATGMWVIVVGTSTPW